VIPRYMTCCRIFSFAAAHQLPNHLGKCKNLHGHTWKLEVCFYGRVNEDGMVIDFGLLKDLVNKTVIDLLDHSLLNELIPNPTAENILLWIWEQLDRGEVAAPRHYRLRLWESDNSYVEYKGL